MDQLLSFLAPYALCHEHKQLEETILQSLLVVNRPTIELPSLQRISTFSLLVKKFTIPLSMTSFLCRVFLRNKVKGKIWKDE